MAVVVEVALSRSVGGRSSTGDLAVPELRAILFTIMQ